jgi:hypothetical protein
VLRAAAVRVRLDHRKLAKKQQARKQGWQDEAWDYFDEVPEVKSLLWFLGNAASKLKIYVAVRPDDDPNAAPIPATDPESGIPLALAQRAQAELNRLKGPLGGRSEIQRECKMNLEAVGECYLVGRAPRMLYADPNDPSKTTAVTAFDTPPRGTVEVGIIPEEWDIRSTREVTVKGDGAYYIRDDPSSSNEGEKLDERVDTIIRIYQRHPGASALADCNMRGVLSECELLTLLTNELKAESKSRQSAGFMTLPNELSYGSGSVTIIDPDDGTEGEPNVEGEDAEEAETDAFEEALMQAIVAPIEDPAAPESVYPLLIRGEAQYLHPDFLRHFSIARDTTQLIEERIEKRVERLARGMNAPVETTMGHQSTTFANAGQVDEDTYEDHLEPGFVLFVDALTVGYLIPNLLDGLAGDPTLIERLIVWFDPSDVIRRTDPVSDADKGLEVGAISWDAWRTYKGFSEADQPDILEHLFRAVLNTSRPDPNLVDAIIRELDPGLDIPEPVQIEAAQDGQAAVDPRVAALRLLVGALRSDRRPEVLAASARVAAREASRPSRQLAAIDPALRSKIIAAADRALARVIEKAGTRLKVKGVQTNALLKTVAPMYAASTLGRSLVAAAGFHDDDLIGDDAWISLETQYRAWVADAQSKSLKLAQSIAPMTTPHVTELARRQASDLEASWEWLADELHTLAIAKLYEPDAPEPNAGEFDPTVRIPAGMIRQALARAGGANNIEPVNNLRAAAISVEIPSYVARDNGGPLGGIGNGALITEALTDSGAAVEAYEWVYGPAFRKSPFEEHEALDGETFVDFDADVLAAGDWVGDFYFPGDHDGCACDFVATWAMPGDLASDDVALSGDEPATDASTSGPDLEAEPAPRDDNAPIVRGPANKGKK